MDMVIDMVMVSIIDTATVLVIAMFAVTALFVLVLFVIAMVTVDFERYRYIVLF